MDVFPIDKLEWNGVDAKSRERFNVSIVFSGGSYEMTLLFDHLPIAKFVTDNPIVGFMVLNDALQCKFFTDSMLKKTNDVNSFLALSLSKIHSVKIFYPVVYQTIKHFTIYKLAENFLLNVNTSKFENEKWVVPENFDEKAQVILGVEAKSLKRLIQYLQSLNLDFFVSKSPRKDFITKPHQVNIIKPDIIQLLAYYRIFLCE